ncbi:MAG TPA: hypothetical protein ENK57_00605 [Polyangiaceae bacterium]|nr:hypothetical protein [Polyangiaceae bacterium]
MARIAPWAVVIVLAHAGCDRRPLEDSPSPTTEPSPPPPCEGREVVSLVAGPRVLRGTVRACNGPRLTIAYGHPLKNAPRPEREVDATQTWDVGKAAVASVDDVGACHYGRDMWKLCKVTAAEDGRFRVASPEGLVREIDGTDMVTLEGASKKTVLDHFALRERERAFDDAVLAAVFHDGSLERGQRVVAPRVGTSFYLGTIVSVSADTVRVRWSNAAWREREVPRRHVGIPSRAPVVLTPGRLILWRTDSERFDPARVVAVAEHVELQDRTGALHRVDTADLEVVLAIETSSAPSP